MSRTCAIVVCDHGLGHLRRCILMATNRRNQGEQVTLFAPRAAIQRLRCTMTFPKDLTVCDFATHTTPEQIRYGLPKAVEWLRRLPSLDNFETVICDNLPEILAVRPDAIILAQFFWHDVIKGAASNYASYSEELLAQYKPTVIGCDLFAMEAVRRQPGFKPVGLYENPELVAASDATHSGQRTDLLVTGGTTSAVHKKLLRLLIELVEKGPGEYKHVHIDNELLPNNAPSWMIKADFSVEMYCKIKAAICRPGLGTITDLITVGAEIVPVYEESNEEMRHNANVLRTISAMTFRRSNS